MFGFIKRIKEKSKQKSYEKGFAEHCLNNSIPPYQLEIANTSNEPKKAIIFGANRNMFSENYGSDKGITITPLHNNVTYSELLMEVANNPIITELIRLQSSNTRQVTMPIYFDERRANGTATLIPIVTSSFFSAKQFQATIVDVDMVIEITDRTQLEINILPSSTLILTMFYTPKSKIDVDKLYEELEKLGIDRSIVEGLIRKRERVALRKLRWTNFKSQLKTFFKFKWLMPKKKEKIEANKNLN